MIRSHNIITVAICLVMVIIFTNARCQIILSIIILKRTHTNTQVTTTLVSMCDHSTVDRNIEAVMRPLTLKEQTVMDEIMRRYFTPLQLTHWEGVEEEHKRQLQDLELNKIND